MRNLVALIRAAGTGLILVALLTGLPWLFLHTWSSGVVTWPDTVTWPDWNTDLDAPPRYEQLADWAYLTYHDLRTALGVDGALVLLVLAAGWVGWAALVVAVVTDLLVLACHGVSSLRARIDTSPRGLVTAAVSGTVLLGSASPAMAATTAMAPPAATAPQHPGPTEPPADTDDVLTDAGEPLDEPPVYTTFRGDTLWDVADRYLDDPYRWPEITALNPGLDDAGLLQPGQHLRMPEPCWLLDPLPAPEGAYTVTVQRGETLSDIAARELGNPDRWLELFDLNTHHRQTDGRTLLDPDFLFPGWQITIPPDNAPLSTPRPEGARPPTTLSQRPAQPSPDTESPPSAGPNTMDEQGAYRHPFSQPALLGLTTGAVLLTAAGATYRYRSHRQAKQHRTDISPGPVVHTVSLPDTHLQHAPDPDTDLASGSTTDQVADHTSSPPPEESTRPQLLLDLGAIGDTLIGLDLMTTGGLGLTGPASDAVLRCLCTQAQHRYPERLVVHTSATHLLSDDAVPDEDVITAVADCPNPPALVALDTSHIEPSLLRWLRQQPHAVVLATGTWSDGTTLTTGPNNTITATQPEHTGFIGARLFTDDANPRGVHEPTTDLHARDQREADHPDTPQHHPAVTTTNPVEPEVATQHASVHPAPLPHPKTSHGQWSWEVTPHAAPAPTTSEEEELDPAAPSTSTQPHARLTVLGPPRLHHLDDGASSGRDISLQPRMVSVLTYLTLYPRGASREVMLEELWGEHATGSNALNTTLTRLRGAVTKHDSALADLVLVEDGRYRLNPDLVTVDYWEFSSALATHRSAHTDEQRAQADEAITATYTGGFAEGLDAAWAEPTRAHTRRSFLDATAARAQALRDTDPHRTLGMLEHARVLVPDHEPLYRDIMRLQAHLGLHEAIPGTLELLRASLSTLGASPEHDTLALTEQLRRS